MSKRPAPIVEVVPPPLRHLCAVALRDYATLLVQQQSLRTPPASVHRAYESLFGSPLHVETLAEELVLLASAIERMDG